MNIDSIEIKAYCKINIALDIQGKRPDGYHEVAMILQTIPFYDVVQIRRRIPPITSSGGKQEVRLRSNAAWLPAQEKNTAFQAALLLLNDYGRHGTGQIPDDLEIYIDKRIPRCGGLGGSSADAAAVLNGLNALYNLKIPQEKLCTYAAEVGSDVPFLLTTGAAVATGTGTTLRYIEPLKAGSLLLVNPNIAISTPEAYRTYDALFDQGIVPQDAHPEISLLEEAMASGLDAAIENLKNVLEYPAFYLYPQLAEIKQELLKAGAAAALMSGSGSTLYGIFRQEEYSKAVRTCAAFRQKGYFTFLSGQAFL